MLRVAALSVLVAGAMAAKPSMSQMNNPSPPKQCAFGCDSDCVKCTGRTTLDDGRQEVTVDVKDCKGSCLSWICARNEGAELVECGTACGGDGGASSSKREASALSRGQGASTKCDETDGATYVLLGGQTTLTLQVHDGRLGGNVMCASKGDCCGGSGSSCADSGVCNFEVDLSTCPGEGPPPTGGPPMPPPETRPPQCPECGTEPAVVRTVGPDNAVENVAEVSPLSQFMAGWQLNGQQFYLYGAHLPAAPATGFFPTQPVAAGSTIEVTCPCNAENKPCEVIVVHYHCPFCTAATNGGLPFSLPGRGWRPGRCGPKMSTTPSAPGDGWSTLAFMKLVASGATVEVPVADDILLEHVGVFVRQCAVDCELVDPMGAIPDECVCAPDNGLCQSAWCPAPPGPGPPGPPGVPRKPCQEEPGCAPTSVPQDTER